MLAAHDGDVGIVVEVDKIVSPPDEHGLARGEDDTDRGNQRSGPRLYWSQRCRCPVLPGHEGAELPRRCKQLARVGAGRGTLEDRWRLESGRLIGHSSLLSAPSQVLGGG